MSCSTCNNTGVVLYAENGDRVYHPDDYDPNEKFEEDTCPICNGQG